MPMRDRLEELQHQRKLLDKGESKPGRESSKKMDGVKTIQMFLTDVNKIEVELTKMKTDVTEIKKLQQDMLSTPFPDSKDVGKYESIGEKVRLDATKIGASLKQLESKYDTTGFTENSTFIRVRTQQLNTLTTEFNITTNEFFRIQAQYMDKMKTRIKRQLSARGDADIDDSKINAILDQDYSVFTENYIADVNDAEQTLQNLEDRKKDILALEKSVTDVNDLFKEINLLVSKQGETIDNIEIAVDCTNEYVESGTKQLHKAKESQARARRRKCCIIIIVLIVLVVIGVIVAISIVSSK